VYGRKIEKTIINLDIRGTIVTLALLNCPALTRKGMTRRFAEREAREPRGRVGRPPLDQLLLIVHPSRIVFFAGLCLRQANKWLSISRMSIGAYTVYEELKRLNFRILG
jgi:hypothetical protein